MNFFDGLTILFVGYLIGLICGAFAENAKVWDAWGTTFVAIAFFGPLICGMLSNLWEAFKK